MNIRKIIITGAASAGLVGAGIGATALASPASTAARSAATLQAVTACVSPRNVVVHLYARATACAKPNHAVEWNVSGKTGQTGPTGPAGVQSVTVPFNNVTTAPYGPSSIPAGETGSYIATCASGQVDFSGGYSMATNADLTVVQDKPTWYGLTNPSHVTTPASGWEVVILNHGAAAVSPGVNVWAVCGTLDGATGTVPSDTPTPDPTPSSAG